MPYRQVDTLVLLFKHHKILQKTFTSRILKNTHTTPFDREIKSMLPDETKKLHFI